MVLFALALAAASAAAATGDVPPAQMQKLLENCDAHKFETIIEVNAGGQTRHSRVKLCGTEGQSDADWVKTLKDAVAKTSANLQMPTLVRDQIVAALNAEIARLSGTAASLSLPPPRANAKTSVLDGLSPLPPLPEARTAVPAAALPAPRLISPGPAPEYAALPPLPAGPTAPVHVLTGGVAAASIPLLPKPRLTFSCETPGETAEGPCTDFSRDTLLTVRADENLPAGTSLRFVLGGDARADVELAELHKGATQRFEIPERVCRHVAGGTLELRIVRSNPKAGPDGQEVGTDGPYDLRC